MAMTVGEMTPISHVRRAIRTAEGELGAIDRMPKALKRRFPAEDELRRRAWTISPSWQFVLGVAFDGQRHEVTDRSSLESSILL
ncbi:hypothetical protein CQY20_33900 [Mycolicibacterium agri]|uniref:Uncharacterized protein n=1 Tax=Mycolicibacterium agri TaxID=36811 RepID=A0A2A7MMW0_MYCAG|nr:hypothetical protein CQY20_33900 [Mycolicibacterium agri]